MDYIEIKKRAEKLEQLLIKYSKKDQEALFLYDAIRNILSDARMGSITKPIRFGDIPGDFYFTERNLTQYQDLESAYAKFKIEISGGKTDKMRAILKTIQDHQAENSTFKKK